MLVLFLYVWDLWVSCCLLCKCTIVHNMTTTRRYMQTQERLATDYTTTEHASDTHSTHLPHLMHHPPILQR